MTSPEHPYDWEDDESFNEAEDARIEALLKADDDEAYDQPEDGSPAEELWNAVWDWRTKYDLFLIPQMVERLAQEARWWLVTEGGDDHGFA